MKQNLLRTDVRRRLRPVAAEVAAACAALAPAVLNLPVSAGVGGPDQRMAQAADGAPIGRPLFKDRLAIVVLCARSVRCCSATRRSGGR